jgi:hypothetical protein
MRDTSTNARQWLKRLLAVCLGLSFFVAIEGLLWLVDAGHPDLTDDPFVGFSDQQPLFVKSADSREMTISPARLRYFAPDSFPLKKSPGTTRIFCLGGSTVQGRPFSKQTSFTTWLQLALKSGSTDQKTKWEVVNCGGVSYASYRLVPILEECLNYEPDLFIICCGHNEFLEDRTYGSIRDQSPLVTTSHNYLSRLRSY